MAHVAKFGAGAAGHMLSHYDRSKKDIGNIDWDRTHLNYNLGPERYCSQVEFIQQRLSEVKVQKRADLNVLCDWVVTLPKRQEQVEEDLVDIPYTEEEEKIFFQEVYKELRDRYGEKNIVSAYVHKDEVQPHMHFAFVPVVEDKKWNLKHPDQPREKLSAKECVTREDLRYFHQELQKRLDERFGEDFFPILNGATIGGNLTVNELKAQTALQELAWTVNMLEEEKFRLSRSCQELEKDLKETSSKLQNTSSELQKASQELQKVEGQVNYLKTEKNGLEAKLEGFKETIEDLNDEISEKGEELDVLNKAIEKVNEKGAGLAGMDEWKGLIERERSSHQEESKQSLLAKFAEYLINQFPAISQLWLQFQQEHLRSKSKKKTNTFEKG